MARKHAMSLKMLAAGETPQDIAQALGVHEASVRNWRKKWQEELATKKERNIAPRPYHRGSRWGLGFLAEYF